MGKSNGNGKAPTAVTVEAHLEAIDDALLVGSTDADADLARAIARGKPVYKRTRVRLRNLRRQATIFNTALAAVDELRRLSQAASAAVSAETPQPGQMRLPLPASPNGSNGAAHVS